MSEETVVLLDAISRQLDTRARELLQKDDERDMAMIMSALAVTMNAVRAMGEDISQMNGPKGLGAGGE